MITVGIDFGTGNTVLSYWTTNKSQIFLLDERVCIPSDVLVNSDGTILIDHRLLNNPPIGYQRVQGIKRKLINYVSTDKYSLNQLVEFASRRILNLYESFSSENLQPITQAVLTCPAHGSQAYRELLMEIGRKVGLSDLAIIDEPTAAAVHHGLKDIPTHEERLLVVDWGCGTCDISLIERRPGNNDLNVVVVRGNNLLGGLDMDYSLREMLAKRYGFDPEQCPLWQVEDLKIRLSEYTEIDEILSLSNGKTIPVNVSREEFEGSIHPLIAKAQGLIRDALTEAHWGDVDFTIATGGPMLMPVVRRALADVLDEDEDDTEFFKWDDPLTSVAQGAAKLAYLKQAGGLLVTNKVAQSIGLRVVHGENKDAFYKVIQRGETRPIAHRSVDIATSQDLQDIIIIEIREGDNISSEANTLLGKLNLVVRPEERGKIKIRLNMSLSDNGALETWVEPLGDIGSVRQVQPLGIRFQKDRQEIQTRETRFSDPVTEFHEEVGEREIDPDKARQIYEEKKFKYHPDRKPEEREYWQERLVALDQALNEHLREIERRMRASTLPDLPWDQPDELQKIVVDEVKAQRLTHCLAQGIGGEEIKNQMVAFLMRYPDYRRVLASYLFAVKRNQTLQELLAQDDRPHIGFVVLLQNLPNKPTHERHEVLKAAYRLPVERVRQLLADPKMDIEHLYKFVKEEAPAEANPMGFRSRGRSQDIVPTRYGFGLTYERDWTWIYDNVSGHEEKLRQAGFIYSGKRNAWFAKSRVEPSDI